MATTNLIVYLNVKADAVGQLASFFEQEFVRRSRTEQGCLEYALWTDPDQPHKKVIIERWASRKDFEIHVAQDWFKQLAPKLESFLNEPPKAQFYTCE